MLHPSIHASTEALEALAAQPIRGPIQAEVPIAPGVSLSWDVASGTTVKAQSGEDLLDLEIQVPAAPPSWLALNLSLGRGHFTKGEALGIVYRGSVVGASRLSPKIRSNRGGKTTDTPLQEPLTFGAPQTTRIAMHSVTAYDGITSPSQSVDGAASEPPYHMLILPLPPCSSRVVLTEFRLFWVDAAHGTALRPTTLSSYS